MASCSGIAEAEWKYLVGTSQQRCVGRFWGIDLLEELVQTLRFSHVAVEILAGWMTGGVSVKGPLSWS